MTGPVVGALLLAVALVVGPPSPRRRLGAAVTGSRRPSARRLAWLGWVAAGAGCAALAVLPLPSVLA
ncbi:hypothetical protein BB737_21260, partial [Mycobacterium avium subsp. hominissuis]